MSLQRPGLRTLPATRLLPPSTSLSGPLRLDRRRFFTMARWWLVVVGSPRAAEASKGVAATSIHGVVFGGTPLSAIFHGDPEMFTVGCGGVRRVAPRATVVQDDQRGLVFPVHQLPGNQRMLCFRFANRLGILLAVVVFPLCQNFTATPVAHGADHGERSLFSGLVAKRIKNHGLWRTR